MKKFISSLQEKTGLRYFKEKTTTMANLQTSGNDELNGDMEASVDSSQREHTVRHIRITPVRGKAIFVSARYVSVIQYSYLVLV